MAQGVTVDITDEQIAKMLQTKRGNISATARSLKCSRQLIHTRINASQELVNVRDAAREATIDRVEQALEDKAIKGDVTAQIFFLKTRGRKRGYSEQTDHSGEMILRIIHESSKPRTDDPAA